MIRDPQQRRLWVCDECFFDRLAAVGYSAGTRWDICSFKVTLPSLQVSVAGQVRWVCGQGFGLETLVMDGQAQAHRGKYVQERIKEL